MKTVFFVCNKNAGRSQMAEAFFNRYSSMDKAIAISAGTEPANEVNPVVVEAMRESGFDLSNKKPKLLTMEMTDKADRVIVMGCGAKATCPAVFKPSEDWQIEDPEGKPIEQVRSIRDEIEARVRLLVAEL
jgi:arsenate reductase (thioredoxin)